jgi:hypothetical protein
MFRKGGIQRLRREFERQRIALSLPGEEIGITDLCG